MNNLDIYEKVRSVPENAQKEIKAGRLKGMTDINPMWRIKVLTEQFGVCGIGWKTQIVRTWLDAGANDEIITNVEILLFVKVGGEWSDGIPGIGGSALVAKESKGLYTDDECYKKAYTDAISVACKALGIGADIYWNENTKYSGHGTKEEPLTYETALSFEIGFGKYKGKALGDVWEQNADYIKWLAVGEKTDARLKEAIELINAKLEEQPKKEEPKKERQITYTCVDCGIDVNSAMAARTQKAFGVILCKDCGVKRSLAAVKNEGAQ